MTNKLPSASGNGRDPTLATKNLVVASSFELTVRTRYRGGNNTKACSNELLAKRGSVKICSLYPPTPLPTRSTDTISFSTAVWFECDARRERHRHRR